jgi:hypothetical protein
MTVAQASGVYRRRSFMAAADSRLATALLSAITPGTAPTAQSASVNVAGTQFSVVFSQSVTLSDESGFDIVATGGALTLTYASGSGSNTIVFTCSRTVRQNEELDWQYLSVDGDVQNGSSVALEDVAWSSVAVTNDSTYTITMPSLPSYTGHPKIDGLTTITPKITCCLASGNMPFTLMVSGAETTCDASAGYHLNDLEFAWDFGDTGGSETFTHPYTGLTANANDEQIGLTGIYTYRSAGSYTVTLTVRGKNDAGQIVSATTTDVLRLAEFEYFDGGGTGGTFTLGVVVDGGSEQTTGTLDYDDDTDTIVAAVAALSNVGSGNVRSTGYGSVEFCGDLAGAAVDITMNSSITGAGTGNSAPDAVVRFTGSSNSSVVVSDLSTWTAAYFDSEAAGGGDGSIGSPYNAWSDLNSFTNTDVDSSDNKVAYIKRGSDFTATTRLKWGSDTNGRMLLPYGSGADPILRDAGLGDHLIELYFAHGATNPTRKQHIIAGMDIRATEVDIEVINAQQFGVGDTTQPETWVANFVVLDCTITRTAGENPLIKTANRGNTHGVIVYNSTLDQGDHRALAVYDINFGQWAGMFGSTISGGGATPGGTVSLLVHFIYAHGYHNACFRWNKSGLTRSDSPPNFSLNLTSDGDADCKWWCVDSNDFGHSPNCIGFANVNNDYDSNISKHVDCCVQFNRLHSSKRGSQQNGITIYNADRTTIRYNDIWDCGSGSPIRNNDDTYGECKVYYNNTYGSSALLRTLADNGYLFGNHGYSTSASRPAFRFDSDQMDITTWEIDANTWYAPNATDIVQDVDTNTWYSITTWRSTFSHDANGQDADPSFVDPDNGEMEYTWASPSYSDTTKPTVQSASISTAGAFYTIVYDEPVTGQTGHTLSATGGAVTLAPSSGDTTDTHVWSLDRTILKTETVTRSYTPGNAQDGSGNTLDAYSGQAVTNGSGMPRPTVSTAAIATAGNAMTLTFAENVTGQLGWLLNATDGAVTATGSSGDGTASHGFSLSRVIGSHETVTLAYDSATGNAVDDDGLEVADFSGLAVTNGSTQDTVDPELSTATISLDGLTLTLVFTEAVTGQTAFTITASGGAATLSSPTGDGTGTFTFTISRAIDAAEVVALDYDSVTGTTQDAAGNTLATITDQPVTILQGGNDVAGTLVAIGVL